MVIESDGKPNIPSVSINSKTDENLIEITSGFPSSIKKSSISLLVDALTIRNKEIDGSASLVGTRATNTYYTSGDYDVIKGTKGSTSNEPTVTILTNPTAPPTSILNSNDINFYVEGIPASLGSAGPKGAAKFGGDVQIMGCVVRGSIMQLYIDTDQLYQVAVADNPNIGTNLASDYPIDVGNVKSVVWDDSTKLDSVYYGWAPGAVADNITIIKSGLYKISYSVNFNQIIPGSNRTNMKVFLNKTSTTADISLLCSDSYSYGRGNSAGDTTSKITNSSTSLFQLSAGDILNLNVVFLPGTDGTIIRLNMLANQTWILIEKVGEI